MLDSTVLLCSTLCKHCIDFIEIMHNSPSDFKDLVVINIDMDPLTGKRPVAYYDLQHMTDWKIKSVPCIITKNVAKILHGSEAFFWLAQETQPKLKTMSSVNQTFSAIGENSCILSDEDIRRKSKEFGNKKATAENYDRLIQDRKIDDPKVNVPLRTLSPPIQVT